MGLLRLAVLGSPEVLHDGSHLTFSLRKAEALLLYLAVEKGLHSRGQLAPLLWPDSEPPIARKALRNALALLRRLLADHDASPVQHTHLLISGELLGLDPQAPLELDLDVGQRVWNEIQRPPMPLTQEQRADLIAQVQYALTLVRGPFLDGFWLGESASFDEWVAQQRQQWQVRLPVLFDRLSSWQEEVGELEQARVTLTRWMALDPLAEEASRRLMRIHLALGDPTAALRVYATCRARLAEGLRVKPSEETTALAEHIRATSARHGGSPARPAAPPERRLPDEFVAPLTGRQTPFSQLVGCYQQARQGQPQAALVVGEAGIGKTRLAREWVAWAAAQGALVLSGQAFEVGGRLPYQPLVEALRPRLEEENAPEDLLEDPWLAELSRILPELRARYPDLPAPTEDELAAKIRLFEAVARLMDALAKAGPLVLLLDDLQWVDGASLDLVRYLGRYWSTHDSSALLLLTVRSEALELNPHLSAHLTDLERDLPLSQVTLQTLSRAETIQLVQSITMRGVQSAWSSRERPEHDPTRTDDAGALSSSELEMDLDALGDFLFTQTDGQPLYLLETLKLFRDRQWLVPRSATDGAFRLELVVELATIVSQERSQGMLLPPSVRALILSRLAPLTQAARHLVQVSAVLGIAANVQLLWQLAEMEVQAGIEALEEAVRSGILREEETGVGRPGSYRFSHDLLRDVVYTELGAARRQILHQRALAKLEREGARASELAYHAMASGETEAAYGYSVQAGDEAMAVFAVEDAIRSYEQARSLHQEQTILPTLEVAHLYANLERAYAFLHAWDQAQEASEELLAYAQRQRQPTLVSMTLNRLALLTLQQSFDKRRARALLEEAWQIAQRSSDQRVLAETEWNLAQITADVWGDPKSALPHGQHALSLAREIHHQELEARSLLSLGWIHLLTGDLEEAIHSLEASLALYARLSHEPTASRELSVAHFLAGSPLTQPLTNRATEALCWEMLAITQAHDGQVHNSICSSRRALSIAQEINNVGVQVNTTLSLTYGLLDAGNYEEALGLMQQAVALARTFPPTINFQSFLIGLGSVYQALQQWEEAHSTLEEAVAIAERLDLRPSRVPALSQLCMHYALAGEWERAYQYALKAITQRKRHAVALIVWDFSRQYETEALLRAGDLSQVRAEVHQQGERLGLYPRSRIPYLRSLATFTAWDGHSEQAIGHLREAAELTADLELPGEQWQIQAALGTLYQSSPLPDTARTAFGEAARIIQRLAQGIKDERLRTRFLAGPPIQMVIKSHDRLS